MPAGGREGGREHPCSRQLSRPVTTLPAGLLLLAPQDVDFTRPTAFVLGNEKTGVSDTVLDMADHTAIIPMHGFVESFNISVAAALTMYEAKQQRLRKLGPDGDLTDWEKQLLKAVWLLRAVVGAGMPACTPASPTVRPRLATHACAYCRSANRMPDL